MSYRLTGKIKDVQENDVIVLLDKRDLEIIGTNSGNLVAGQPVIISIRPEKMRLSDQPVLNQNSIRATVVSSAYIGSDTRLLIDIDNKLSLKIWEQNKISTLDPNAYYRQGQQVWVNLFPENTLVMSDE